MKFEPISTAPRDGTPILLLFATPCEVIGRKEPRVRAARWCCEGEDWTIPYWRRNPPIGWAPMPGDDEIEFDIEGTTP